VVREELGILCAAACGASIVACGVLLEVADDEPAVAPDEAGVDAHDDAAAEAAADADAGVLPAKRVFLSSASINGGSPAIATMCQTLADARGLGGSFIPWLSFEDGGVGPLARLGPGPWYFVDKTTLVASGRDALAGDAGLAHAIDHDEDGSCRRRASLGRARSRTAASPRTRRARAGRMRPPERGSRDSCGRATGAGQSPGASAARPAEPSSTSTASSSEPTQPPRFLHSHALWKPSKRDSSASDGGDP